MLRLENINKTFEKGAMGEKKALIGVNLYIKDGDFVSVVGSNGSGKSTLFNIIGGKLQVDEGSIHLAGEDITNISEHKRAQDIGRLMQDPLKGTAPSLNIQENLALAKRNRSKSSIFPGKKEDVEYFRELLATLNLGLEDRMKTPVGNLSGGQRQAITLLMCTISSPKLLLLDEHTAALDPVNAKKIIEMTEKVVQEKNLTTMMITHDIKIALSVGNRTIMMDEGRIILDLQGEERDNMTLEALMERYRKKSNKMLLDDRMLLS